MFERAVGSSTMHKRTREESHPPMLWVTGRETSVPPVDLQWLMNQLQPLLDLSWDLLENWLRQSPPDESAGNTGFWRRSSSTPKKQKNKKEFGHTGVGNRKSLTSPPPPKAEQRGALLKTKDIPERNTFDCYCFMNMDAKCLTKYQQIKLSNT